MKKLSTCPYCKHPLRYKEAWSLRKSSTHTCLNCKKNITVDLNSKIYRIATVVITISFMFTILSLIFIRTIMLFTSLLIILPFIFFYIISPFYVNLKKQREDIT